MVNARVASTIGRFFFLALLDEHEALVASTKTLTDWRSRLLKSPAPNKESTAILVEALSEAWRRLTKVPQTGQPVVFSEQDWILPSSLDLGAWFEFRRDSHRDEFFALVTVQILKLPVEDVAAGLRETPGTIRHRLGRALRQLGEIQIAPREVQS